MLSSLVALGAIIAGVIYAVGLSETSFNDIMDSYQQSQDVIDDAVRMVDTNRVLLEDVFASNKGTLDSCADAYNLTLDLDTPRVGALTESDLIEGTVASIQDVYERIDGYGNGKMLAIQWAIRITVVGMFPILLLTLIPTMYLMVRTTLSTASGYSSVQVCVLF
jgi:hypothetical protein